MVDLVQGSGKVPATGKVEIGVRPSDMLRAFGTDVRNGIDITGDGLRDMQLVPFELTKAMATELKLELPEDQDALFADNAWTPWNGKVRDHSVFISKSICGESRDNSFRLVLSLSTTESQVGHTGPPRGQQGNENEDASSREGLGYRVRFW